MRHLTVGIAAHVDAGKTTLCEGLLYHAGVLREKGRVDRGSAAMDQDPIERERGISIFAQEAEFEWKGTEVTLLDTPGHADFIGQTERAMEVMDLCILVVSARDGVQSGTRERLGMLRRRQVPILVFINKMDQTEETVREVAARLDLGMDLVVLEEGWQEEAALYDEDLLEKTLEGTAQEQEAAAVLLREMKKGTAAPVCFGSALRDEGIPELLDRAVLFCPPEPSGEEAFSAQVYRCTVEKGQRICYARITSGMLRTKAEVETVRGPEKVHLMQALKGLGLVTVEEAQAGQVVALSGLEAKAGERIGSGAQAAQVNPPMMTLEMVPEKATLPALLSALRQLEVSEPRLCVTPARDAVQVGLFGATQQEVLLSLLQRRFGISVRSGQPRVRYQETITRQAVGIGHYEPLRHYAEAWLRLTPGEPGSGITFDSECPVETLALNWQRLIRTHIFERPHPGVLTGSPVTDIRVTLLTGRSHLKHTEGGDFREATCRALRQGLMQAGSVLLEPVVRYEMRLPEGGQGRMAGELRRIGAKIEAQETYGQEAVLSGTCRLSVFWPFSLEFPALTHGQGALFFEEWGTMPCPDAERIIKERGYVPTEDAEHPVGSVFCSHGAGFPVAWDHVREWAHCGEGIEA